MSILKKARILIAGREFSGQSKSLGLSFTNPGADATVMGSDWEQVIAGISAGEFSVDAFSDYGTQLISNRMFALNGSAPFNTLLAERGVAGDQAFMQQAVLTSQERFGAHGEPEMINFSGKVTGVSVQGTVMEDGHTLRSSTSQSTGYAYGPVPAIQNTYAQLQVLSGSAGTLDVVIESDVDNSFASPTTRLTFAQVAAASAPTSQFVNAVGPAGSDDTWRVKWTIAGGDWLFVVTFGVR